MDENQLIKLVKLTSALKCKVQCSICLDFTIHVAELPCTHRFCNSCVLELRSKSNATCPLCCTVISRRSVCYKDQFGNKLSKFVSDVCQLIKEQYAYEVDELCSNKCDLKKIIELAPQDSKTSASSSSSPLKSERCSDAFDLLKSSTRKCYVNKKRESLKNSSVDITDPKAKVVNWLNKNDAGALNFITQNVHCLSQEDDDFQLPSISQVVSENREDKAKKKTCQVLPIQGCETLKEIMNDRDDYNIEETNSEALVRQAKIIVVQELLEDECLANLERIAKVDKEKSTNSKNTTNVSPDQKNGKRRSSGKKSASPNDSGSSSAWDRMENLTKSVKKGSKGYKQLKIHEGSGNDKGKMVTRNGRNSKNNDKKIIGESKGKDNSYEAQKKNLEAEKSPNPKMVVVLNRHPSLDIKENNLENVKENRAQTDSKNQKSDLMQGNNVNGGSTDSDDEIFYLATQITPETMNKQNTAYAISPIPHDLENVNGIAICLTDHLKACAKAANLDNSKGLAACFANLLSYANRIVRISSEEVIKKIASTHTAKMNLDVAVQTEIFNANKHVQTANKQYHNIAVQAGHDLGVDKAIQANEEHSLNSIKANEHIPRVLGNISSKSASQSKLSGESIIHSTPSQVLGIKARTSKNSTRKKASLISTDESKESQPAGKSNGLSEGSVLTCSLDFEKGTSKRTSRKLTSENSQNRRFKRIRQLRGNSYSDESENPSKRKFVRDDLSVEFADTEPSVRHHHELQCTLDSQNMNYDEYLLEVMEKYDAAPPNKSTNKTDKNTSLNTNKEKASNADLQKQKSQNEPDSGDHVFTACLALEENLSKFDNDILQFEKSIRTCNTEMDVVENTPAISPKAKRIRLSSNKKPNRLLKKRSVTRSPEGNNGLTEDLLGTIVGPSTLNQNIETLPSQTEKLTENVRDLLNELKHNGELFEDNIETEVEDSGADAGGSNIETITQANINANLHDFDDDQEIEEELRRISFTRAGRNKSTQSNIVVLENIKLTSQSKFINRQEEPDNIICSSDEEIIETTPKKNSTSMDRSALENLCLEENRRASATDDSPNNNLSGIFLPPPPEFDDEPNLSQCSQKENICNLTTLNKSSLTADRFTDFLVTPDENARHSQKATSFGASFATPKRTLVKKLITPKRSEGVLNDTKNKFSPIAKSSKPITQNDHNPLVFTPQLSLKKPTLLTSTPNQKSILNYVVSSPAQDNSSKQVQKRKPCIMWSRILNKDLNVFTQLECKKLLTTSKVFSPKVTHVIVLVDEKGQIISHTAKILQSIAAGIWVVRYEWAVDCLRMNRIVPEDQYEALDVSGIPGPQLSRLSNKSKPLFERFRFYCALPLESISRDDLQSILQLAGGEIAVKLTDLSISDGKINLILTESSASEETEQFEAWLELYKAVTVDVEWLTICIGQHEVVSFRPYLVAGDEATICDLGYPSTLIQSVPFSLTETT